MKHLLLNLSITTLILGAPVPNTGNLFATSERENNDNKDYTYELLEPRTLEVEIFKDYLLAPEVLEQPTPEPKFYVTTVPLNVRQTPGLELEPVGWLGLDQPVKGINVTEAGWVELDGGTFVNGKYLAESEDMTEEEFTVAVEQYQEEQERILEEKRAQAAAERAERARLAQVQRNSAAEVVVKQVQQKQAQQSTQSTSRYGVSLSSSETDLLARLVRAEAGGESYEGMVAVASVVFNRLASSKFPNTVTEIVYARNQFSPVSNGSINKPASDIHYKAVADALTRDNTNGATFFYAPSLVKSRYMESLQTVAVIGTHHFKVN